MRIVEAEMRFDQVVLTLPAPQILRFLGAEHGFSSALSSVDFAPCLTLMAAFDPATCVPFLTRRSAEDPLAWIACDSSKPGRDGPGAWVAQASPAWSRSNLERDMTDIAERLLPMLCRALDKDIRQAAHRAAHRWRYAVVTAPLGAPFLKDATGTLFAGGGWCIGARAEAAWTSGKAITDEVLRRM